MLRRLAARLLRPRRHVAALVTAAAPDEALLGAIAVLRALGGRITRYDGKEGSLEACLVRWRGGGTIRVQATARATGALLRVDSDAPAWGATRRLLERELGSVRQPREERDR